MRRHEQATTAQYNQIVEALNELSKNTPRQHEIASLRSVTNNVKSFVEEKNLGELWTRSGQMERQIDVLRTRVNVLEVGVPGPNETNQRSPAVVRPTPEGERCDERCDAAGCTQEADFAVLPENFAARYSCAGHLVFSLGQCGHRSTVERL